MIRFLNKHIRESRDEIVICPCNCLGEFGVKSGVSRSFKDNKKFFEYYRSNCKAGNVFIGEILSWSTEGDFFPRSIWIVPTKSHWRDGSYLEWVEMGLKSVAKRVDDEMIISLGIPLLGCDFKGLSKETSKELIVKHLSCLEANINVYKKGCRNDFRRS